MTTLTFEKPAALLSLNDRHHWAKRAQLARLWRDAACLAACALGPPSKRVHPRSLVIVTLPVRSLKTKRDAHNYFATVKPIIDGLVDAGVWPDDDGHYVVTAEPRFEVGATVTIALEGSPFWCEGFPGKRALGCEDTPCLMVADCVTAKRCVR